MKPIPSTIPLITFSRRNVLHVDTVIEYIFNLFPDHYPVVMSENADQWVIGLQWSTDPRWYIDPNVAQTALELYKIPLENVVPFYQVESCYDINFVFSMFHSRAIIAASLATKRYNGSSFDYIIHVDDHTDLMHALIYLGKAERILYDSVFNRAIDIANPESVVAAIERGIINKGNFLTTYLLASHPATLIHIGESLRDKEYWLEVTSSNFNLAGEHFNSTGFIFREEEQSTSWHFKQTPVLPCDLSLEEDDMIWLDIDLDAFCNRYNGDSDHALKPLTIMEQEETIRGIESFLYNLSNVSWLSQVKAVSIAVSPGFFPTDYWEYAIPKVYEGVKRIICRSQTNF